MKELTIEQKAKRYDEILAIAQGAKLPYCKEDTTSKVKEFVDYLLPELKKSDDENIRKHLISFIKDVMDFGKDADFNKYYKSDCAVWIAWLEKQGELKNEYEDKLDRCACENFDKGYKAALEKQVEKANPYSGTSFEHNGHIWGMCARDNGVDILLDKQLFKHLAPQDEHKQHNSETKFKVGDWITRDGATWQVLIANNNYILLGQDGTSIKEKTSIIDSEFHLWTIQDAEDGDVLVKGSCICLFSSKEMKNGFFAAKTYLFNDEFYCGETVYVDINGIKPAIKEQRYLLFQKMKEAGYAWDSEKKELRKIEQNPTWIEEDKIISNEIKCLISNYRTGDDEHKLCSWIDNIKERVQPLQNQEWSEEDEIGFGNAMWAIEQARTIAKDENDMGNLWHAGWWLNSIKQRMQR